MTLTETSAKLTFQPLCALTLEQSVCRLIHLWAHMYFLWGLRRQDMKIVLFSRMAHSSMDLQQSSQQMDHYGSHMCFTAKGDRTGLNGWGLLGSCTCLQKQIALGMLIAFPSRLPHWHHSSNERTFLTPFFGTHNCIIREVKLVSNFHR